MKINRRHVQVALMLVLPLVLLLGIAIAKFRKPRVFPLPPVQKLLSETWKGQPYIDIRTNQIDLNLNDLVAEIPVKSTIDLEAMEKKALTDAVSDFVEAYQKGTFEAMFRFRFPVKSYAFTKSITNAMYRVFHIPLQKIQEDPKFAFQVWWNETRKDLFTNYWSGLSITESQIRVFQTNSVTNDLTHVLLTVEKVPNLGLSSPHASVLLQPSAEDVLAKYKTIHLAIVKLLPHPRDDEAYPVYLKLYWSPDDAKWLPQELVTSSSRPDRKVTYFF